MERQGEAGNSLVETAIAIAIVAILAGAASNAVILTTHAAATNPTRDALHSAVASEMRVAADVLKYRGASVAPVTIATTLPMAGGSPLPVEMSVTATPLPHDAVRVTIAAAVAGSRERTSLTTTLSDRAPLPGATVFAPGLAPAPTGAP